MFRRRSAAGTRGPGLAGTVARTAVIAGTATATSNAVNRSQQQKAQAAAQVAAQESAEKASVAQLQQQMADLQSQQLQSQIAPASSAVPANDVASQLLQLAQLQQSGVLTEAEFNAAKARLLGM